MLKITKQISLSESEFEFTFIRSPGPGGQNVNKVASAVQLRFNVLQCFNIPQDMQIRFQARYANRITQHGDIIIKASRFRTQERNKQDALERLQEMLMSVATPPKKRKKTKPTFGSVQARLSKKKLHSRAKALRGKKIEQ